MKFSLPTFFFQKKVGRGEKLEFTHETLAQSLAGYLAPVLPESTFYQDPTQQHTKTPCLFVQQRSCTIVPMQGGRERHNLGMELTYLEQGNQTDQFRRYEAVAHRLDEVMDLIPYTNQQGETALLRTFQRSWELDKEGLHYRFSLAVMVQKPEQTVKMGKMHYQEEVEPGETIYQTGSFG